MSTLQITLSEELDRFVAAKVEDGTCTDANAVIQTALRRMEQEEREDEEKMVALRKAIQDGIDSGVAEGDVFAELYSYIDEVAAKSKKEKSLAGV